MAAFFACQQTVNDSPRELLIFIPTGTPGHYHTQSVMPEGRAGGLGELVIDGPHWTFLSSWNQGSRTTHYRTLNTFAGDDKIHYEQQESDDNKTWKTTNSGDEQRVGRTRVTR